MNEFTLQVLSGAQAGKKIRISGPLSLGRSPDNGLSFSGADASLVSSQHASLEIEGDHLVVRDLGSTNGTFVNGEQVTEAVLAPGAIFSLGNNGPKMRVLAPGDSTTTTQLRSPAGSEARPKAGPGQGTQLGRNTPSPGFPGFGNAGDAGDYTIGLAQRLKNDEADHGEIQGLIKDEKRADRLVKAGILNKRDARMIEHASKTYSAGKKRSRIIIAAVGGVGVLVAGFLLAQNLGYRAKLKQQGNLMKNISELEAQLAAASSGSESTEAVDHEKAMLVSKLRAAERQLVSVRLTIRSKDLVATYKNPLGREIHTIMEGFGKRDYIVPDIFISQVQKHIYTFTKTSTRALLERSFANARYHKAMIENELAKRGMPPAFYYLAMHESMLDSAIVSAAGARGLWQFMPQTARDYGLHVPQNWRELPPEEDQRTHPLASTHAGIKYVKNLWAEFGDVALAMAAYNAGEGRIRKALRAIEDPVNNRDFWYIYRMGNLAAETNEYVPKIIATMIVDRNRSKYGFAP